jgi:hypothetical protein
MPSVGRIADRMAKVGRTRVVVSENPTASGFCLCLASHCGRVVECHSPHAAMSAGCHFPLSRLSRQEALLSVRLQLLFSASTLQALSASELRKRPSWASTFKSETTTQNSRCSSDESSHPKIRLWAVLLFHRVRVLCPRLRAGGNSRRGGGLYLNDLPDIGTLEKIGAIMFRPHLCITHRGERKVEQVAVKYSRGHYEPFDSVLSTATVIGHGESSFIGKSKYIRAWVYNTFGFVARRCQVFVENIWLDHRLIEAERTPLHWADLDDVYVFPAMHQGHKYGHYIDICASDSIEPTLQIIRVCFINRFGLMPDTYG